MLITVDSKDPRPIYLQIADEVRRALVIRTLSAGDPLPSVRQLAGELRINPNTVSQAYQELERQGLVEVRRGQGTYAVNTGINGTHRAELAREVAARALRDAHRNGLDAETLIHAIREESSLHSKND